MDLLQVIVPDPNSFYIELKNGERVGIVKYSKINIDFSERVEYRNGDKNVTRYPIITYYIKMNDKEKEKLAISLFDIDNFKYSGVVRTFPSLIVVGDNKYKFKVFITAAADSRWRAVDENKVNLSEWVKVELRLEHTNINLFGNIDDEYEKISRYEILDL